MITADQIVAHLVGDYIIQSKWMAETKTKKGWMGHVAAFVHAVTYTLPFLAITTDWKALLPIALTHFVIDRTRLVRHVIWARNWAAPPDYNPHWDLCRKTGAPDKDAEQLPWLHTWLMIIADNTLHLLCNGLSIWLVSQ